MTPARPRSRVQDQAAPSALARGGERLTAVLGPTNTGKTHLAVERMLGHATGMIGLPLRLLAREIYDRVVAQRGAASVALITGEEKIVPAQPRYFVSTVESMPLDRMVDFLAVDEIQLCADPERGHVFTDRLLRARGTQETMFLGSDTIRPILRQLLLEASFIARPRFSDLSYTGPRKLSRLPRRSAIVAFSAEAVYGLAELIRRQRGGAAVVMGALSPRTRNAQVALYQSGDVDFLVATDAIGMGLNMDIDHVAFASLAKFDGESMRPLRAYEIAQIAGRAGRYMNDGTFGPTGEVPPLAPELVEQIENHRFDPARVLQWRSHALDFQSIEALVESLEAPPPVRGLARARMADDLTALKYLAADSEIVALASAPAAIRRLWEVCQIPDFRKSTPDEHARLLGQVYRHLMHNDGLLPADWVARQVERIDCVEGDLDTLSQRIAQIRIWTYVAHHAGWLADAAHWQERTRAIEDALSDALHQALTLRFIDRRTSVLIKRLRQEDELVFEVMGEGEVLVEGEYVGRLSGFQFVPDPRGGASELGPKTLRHAAMRALGPEIAARAARLAAAEDAALSLSEHGKLWWEASPVARLSAGADALSPQLQVLADDLLSGGLREAVQARLERFVGAHIARNLAPLIALRDTPDLGGLARGLAFDLVRQLGGIPRSEVAETVHALDQEARAKLRKLGVRFGAHSIFLPALLKPAAASLKVLLWTIAEGARFESQRPHSPAPGLVSVAVESDVPRLFYERAGFRPLGSRAIRLDMLERLADLIRPPKPMPPPSAQKQEPQAAGSAPPVMSVAAVEQVSAPPSPEGAPANHPTTDYAAAPAVASKAEKASPVARDGSFAVTAEMMSIVGCTSAELEGVLSALGYRRVLRRDAAGADRVFWRPQRRRSPGAPKRKPPAQHAQRTEKTPVSPMPPPGKKAPAPPAARQRREKEKKPPRLAADPNSPFAVLAALKPMLAKRR
jgi:ATP-dependent RNA helicase SUPV3L1/SUV3